MLLKFFLIKKFTKHLEFFKSGLAIALPSRGWAIFPYSSATEHEENHTVPTSVLREVPYCILLFGKKNNPVDEC
ncbi:hypothetical protein, partial [Pseudomonas syringae]|uniref:hypothetical protein n=1 Tax=Pseudomonas syringae TaxID=317 RepID=UPI0034D52F56